MTTHKYDQKDIDVVDKQIATLMECKPLPESEVRALSDKVKRAKIELIWCVGKGDPDQRVQRVEGACASDDLR